MIASSNICCGRDPCARVALRIIFKESAELRNDFRRGVWTVQEVCNPEESDVPQSDEGFYCKVTVSVIIFWNNVKHLFSTHYLALIDWPVSESWLDCCSGRELLCGLEGRGVVAERSSLSPLWAWLGCGTGERGEPWKLTATSPSPPYVSLGTTSSHAVKGKTKNELIQNEKRIRINILGGYE